MEQQKYGGRMYTRWNGRNTEGVYNRWNGRNTEGGCTLDGTAEIRREDVQ